MVVHGIGFELFQPERDAAVLGMHLQYHRFHLIAGPHHFRGMFHAPRPRHLADVDQTLHPGFQFHEGAVIGHIDHAADHAAVHRVALQHRVPRVRLQLLDAQRDALLAAVELENLDRHILAHLQHLRRMRDPAVGHVGNVQQSVDTAQIDERAVFGQVLDRAHDGRALGQVLQGDRLARIDLFLDRQLCARPPHCRGAG